MDAAVLAALRARLGALEPGALEPGALEPGVLEATPALSLGDARLDACFPGGGLPLGALHEIGAHGLEVETAAVMAGFVARLLSALADARALFWMAPCCDLYAPGLLGCGLDPGRLVMVRTAGDAETLAAMEAALRAGAAAAVVGEVGRLDPLPARRLQLACRKRGSTGFVLRRWPYGRREVGERATAAVTRWEVAPAPSVADFREPGPPRWQVRLLHARGGQEGAWIVEMGIVEMGEARNGVPHPFRVVAELGTPADRQRRAG
jgi:protein ImuA